MQPIIYSNRHLETTRGQQCVLFGAIPSPRRCSCRRERLYAFSCRLPPWLKYRSLPFNRSSIGLSEKPKNSYVTFLTRRLARLAKMASTQSVSQDHTDHKPSFSTGASASNTTTRKWGRLIQAASGGMIGGGGGASDLKRGSLGGAGAGKNLP